MKEGTKSFQLAWYLTIFILHICIYTSCDCSIYTAKKCSHVGWFPCMFQLIASLETYKKVNNYCFPPSKRKTEDLRSLWLTLSADVKWQGAKMWGGKLHVFKADMEPHWSKRIYGHLSTPVHVLPSVGVACRADGPKCKKEKERKRISSSSEWASTTMNDIILWTVPVQMHVHLVLLMLFTPVGL